MSLKSAPFFWLECDDCGVKSTNCSDYVAWQDADMAEEEASCSDWYTEDGIHYCFDCRNKHICVECVKPSHDLVEETCPNCREEEVQP